ncbi:MAG: alpha-2-macroglobulin family protein [Anaerolineae bacterium]
MLRKLTLLVLLISALAACARRPIPTPATPSAYMALAPARMYAGERQAVSLSLWAEDKPASGWVEISLHKEGQQILRTKEFVSGKETIQFQVPSQPGQYDLVVSGPGFEDKAQVQVTEGLLIFLESDKPIYKPGQQIEARIVTLDSELLPKPVRVTMEVLDAKGIKVARQEVETDEYGMGHFSLPLSTEPNLGTWKITASVQEQKAQVDVRVEKYVLPKYEVKVELPRNWFLPNEAVEGTVTAEYSFGKKVVGELVVTAFRYVGQWEEFARFTADIDGEASFEIPPVGYVAGVPAQRGMGNVQLEVVVQEKATGYEEKTTRLLTVAQSELSLQLIPEGSSFKPGLPFNLLLVTETPDNQPVDAKVELSISYLAEDFQYFDQEMETVWTEKGKALVTVTPPSGAIALEAQAQSGDAYAWKMVRAGYSPSGHFIHLEQVSSGPLAVGDRAEFKVYSTREATNFYYEVLSRGRVVFTDYTRSDTISFQLTPLMAPSSKLLVYQILPNSEVAADWLPFDVAGDYPHRLSATFSQDEVGPGDELDIQVQAEGQSRVGLAVVDRSVYILAENRLNLQQVFDELERLYMEPQVELHEAQWMPKVVAPGAWETFEEAGMVVLTNRTLPTGKEYERPVMDRGPVMVEKAVVETVVVEKEAVLEAPMATPAPAPAAGAPTGLAEVQRVRQFFPETWIWATLDTEPDGKGSLTVVAPDTITTWQMRAVGISKEKGLGLAEDQLRVFQPFFLSVDLPYSCIRGEEFPVRVALYNYLEEPQEIYVEIEGAEWFELRDEPTKVITIPAGDIGGVSFDIRPNSLGTQKVKITARSTQAADAVIKDIIVEPEGVQREEVKNLVLSAPSSKVLSTALPAGIVEGSARAYLAVTASYLAQTIEGLDGLLIMPFGCGEQNMMGLAPDVFIARYLEETGQMKPEVMAKAELLMITGYQRELTFMRSDGSFSAFGQEDPEGSLFLTAFVLKTFAQAQGLMYVDPQILSSAQDWIIQHQNADGSFDPVGFVCHQEMMGGLTGKTTLTAYVAIALLEAGEQKASRAALLYLQEELPAINDPYTMALVAYALELGENPGRDMAYEKLMDMASEDEEGLRWAQGAGEQGSRGAGAQGVAVEATGYALLALLEHGDQLNASQAARWLVTQRNAFGGFNSTQDTVVGIQALTAFATGSRADVDLMVKVETKEKLEQLHISPENYDVLQLVELPVDEDVAISVEGEGQAVAQLVLRYNLPEAEKEEETFHISVDYDTHQVEVNDRIEIGVEVEFDPPVPIEAGMTVLDISVPTGFVPVEESIQEVVDAEPRMKRYDVAARKVIFYIEDMAPGDKLEFKFEALASYPVKAKGVTSQVYAYYKPEWKGETLSQPVVVGE